jgi:peptidoglycan-associated lipoprotein
MIKIDRKIGTAVFFVLCMLFTSGCSKKADVSYAESTTQDVIQDDKEAIKTTENTISGQPLEVDNKLSYINVVTSRIGGQNIDLSSVHFAFDKFDLSDSARVITKTNYQIINPILDDNNNVKIKLEGNCDEWGTDEYNYALGLKRAKTVKDALVNDGVAADKIFLVTFGESNPLCTDKTADCGKRNRRTDYRLLP